MITRKELSLLCCNRFRYKLNFYFRIMAMMVDLGVGLYFIINNVYFDYIYPAVWVFPALSIVIGMFLTCHKCCSKVRDHSMDRSGCDDMVKKPCCSLYIILHQMREQSSATNTQPVEFSNQIVNHTDTVIPGEIMLYLKILVKLSILDYKLSPEISEV